MLKECCRHTLWAKQRHSLIVFLLLLFNIFESWIEFRFFSLSLTCLFEMKIFFLFWIKFIKKNDDDDNDNKTWIKLNENNWWWWWCEMLSWPPNQPCNQATNLLTNQSFNQPTNQPTTSTPLPYFQHHHHYCFVVVAARQKKIKIFEMNNKKKFFLIWCSCVCM